MLITRQSHHLRNQLCSPELVKRLKQKSPLITFLDCTETSAQSKKIAILGNRFANEPMGLTLTQFSSNTFIISVIWAVAVLTTQQSSHQVGLQ